MTPEVSAAAKFISTCLYGKLPRRRADLFGAEFAAAVTRKFQVCLFLLRLIECLINDADMTSFFWNV